MISRTLDDEEGVLIAGDLRGSLLPETSEREIAGDSNVPGIALPLEREDRLSSRCLSFSFSVHSGNCSVLAASLIFAKLA